MVIVAWFLPVRMHAQVNAYAKVTSIAGTTINLSTVSETFDTFEDGEQVIIMQMQDTVIGNNTTNTSSFGAVSTIVKTGLFEIATMSSHTETASLPTSMTFSAPLVNSYTIGTNSSVQIVSFPSFGSPNYTTAAAISAVSWNGSTGGVVAFQVPGILTLANSVTADGAGFRGGSRSANYYPGGTTCDTIATTWRSASNTRGEKGESIYLRTNAQYRYGKGRIINGGGGGVNINSGGGGGGNYTAGGDGGPGWNSTATGCPAGAQGLGGASLSAYISSTRIFMGGGGGGGQQNDGVGTSGGNGGGIVLIKATQIKTVAPCSGLVISANGQNVTTSGNDGNGGGGGAGTIVLDVGSYAVAAGCSLTIRSNGGKGGDVTDAGLHAGGGGGGQGAIIFSGPQPTTNVTSQTNNGAGGNNNASVASSAQSGQGSNGSGIILNTGNPLPIELLSFTGEALANGNQLYWTTATETNNAYFTVEQSADAVAFEQVTTVNGAGNSTSPLHYTAFDPHPYPGTTYYRLKQTDFNGNFVYSSMIAIVRSAGENVTYRIYPNPASDLVHLDIDVAANDQLFVQIIDCLGHVIRAENFSLSKGANSKTLSIGMLDAGLYMVKIQVYNAAFSDISRVLKY